MVQDSTTRRLDTILNHLATSYDPLAPSFPKKQTGDAKNQTTFLLTEKETGNSWVLPGPVLVKDGQSGTPTTFAVIPGSPNTNSLTVLDNRTNRLYTVPIENNAVKALEFKKITAETGGSRAEDETDRGLRVYDPAFQNTAVCKSRITYIDGDAGILRYRGYPIEELSEKSTYLEVAYLLLFGELPTKKQFKIFNDEVMHHTFLHVQLGEITKRFNYDAHPMGLFVSGVAAMSTFHPEANPALAGQDVFKKDVRQLNKQIFRLLGKVPTLAAMSYRHRIGREYVAPRSDLSYTENFLFMLDHLGQSNYKPNPVLVKALDVLFILHADHELNCSTAAMRHIGSSMVDPYTAVSGAAAALYGPLHGGANEAVLRMLEEIGTVENVPKFLEDVRNRKKKLSGFGHRVYKNYDPRAKIISKIAKEVFEVTGREPLIQVAEALEKAALADEFFVKRKLYPNVDFFSGIIYKAMGMPLDYFPVLFAIPRVSGWLAHWKEQLADADQKIWRPRQLYDGSGARSYVPMESRDKQYEHDMSMPAHKMGKRTMFASYDSKEGGKRGEE